MKGATTILDQLQAAEGFAQLLAALEAAGLAASLQGEGPLTMFAPDDRAWARLPEGTLAALLGRPELLAQMLSNHLVAQALAEEQLRQLPAVSTLHGRTLPITPDRYAGLGLRIGHARIEEALAPADNGQVYRVDTVLLPVAPPAPEPPADPLPQEEWLPYAEGQPLPIGDAELVPGHPAVRAGLKLFEAVLTTQGVTLNTARAVRLEERGEVTYRAPRGPSGARSLEREQILGLIVIEGETALDRGAYLDLLRPTGPERARAILAGAEPEQVEAFLRDQAEGWLWERVLIDGQGRPAHTSLCRVQEHPTPDEVPSTGIWYGTKICTHEENGVKFCEACYWYENLPWVPECKG